jgi:hypothetical protein
MSNNSFQHSELGTLNSGDKVKVKVLDYKPTTLFEAVVFFSVTSGHWFLLQNKIKGDAPFEGTGSYAYGYAFTPDEDGDDDDAGVFIKRIISQNVENVLPVPQLSGSDIKSIATTEASLFDQIVAGLTTGDAVKTKLRESFDSYQKLNDVATTGYNKALANVIDFDVHAVMNAKNQIKNLVHAQDLIKEMYSDLFSEDLVA